MEANNQKMNIVEIRELSKIYENGNVVNALDKVNLDIEEGKFCAILGTSGCGKSTLLHILGGMDYATEGMVKYQDKYGSVDITQLGSEELTLFRRKHIGFIFQKYNLLPILTTYENVIFSLQLDSREVDTKLVEQVMKKLNIWEKKDFYPNQLSGGQQQRVAIARAIVMKPALILADEPTGNLDKENSRQVIDMLREAVDNFQQTVVMVTHDEEQAKSCDVIIRLEDGKIKSTMGRAMKKSMEYKVQNAF